MSFVKTFRVERVAFDASGKESVLVEQAESNILPATSTAPPCRVHLFTEVSDEFCVTELNSIFEVSFKRVWPEEKE